MLRSDMRAHTPARILISLALLGSLLLPGCLFRKNKPGPPPTFPAPVRLLLLPLNIPRDYVDLRWASLATAVMMAEIALAAPDLEPVPLWESWPAALQTLGQSRTITPEIAEFTAARLTARWAGQGDLLIAQNAFIVRVDFVPSRPSLVPFRYEKSSSLDGLAPRFLEAFEQFLRYLTVRPFAKEKIRPMDAKQLQEVAQALDVEYGWFVPAKPGNAAKLVGELANVNRDLARLLFNPSLYPILAKQ
jgi:hypothetical protein